jgi:hypothetical protein
VKVEHLEPSPKDIHFQDYAFDPSLGSTIRNRELSRTNENFDTSNLKGFQITESGVGAEKEIPAWVWEKTETQKVLLTAFPKLATDKNQRKRAGRWAQVINLYYLQGMTAEEVARELNETRIVIKRLIISISRISKGLTVNGCQRKR